MKAKYDEQLRRRQAAGLGVPGQEDLSDMVAEHAARQKTKRKRQQEKQEPPGKQAKKYKFKF
ncbi:unnamed protein product [Notodromas monacha]|nr:unnamed protein product [Notodromas monacha]CAD7285972.1 unnamed protein product [Notodromas monacha]CAG0923137.1 unnamed protein product [Notodromas monacha]CAG0926124.1 unnamed protein product [Notodromas monacha]